MVDLTHGGWTAAGWNRVCDVIERSEYDYSCGFILWLGNNPLIWQGFANKALKAHSGGHKHRFGAKAILEILRWESVKNDSEKTFKINNNRAPDLARLVMDCKPEMKGYFQIRRSAYKNDAPK